MAFGVRLLIAAFLSVFDSDFLNDTVNTVVLKKGIKAGEKKAVMNPRTPKMTKGERSEK